MQGLIIAVLGIGTTLCAILGKMHEWNLIYKYSYKLFLIKMICDQICQNRPYWHTNRDTLFTKIC